MTFLGSIEGNFLHSEGTKPPPLFSSQIHGFAFHTEVSIPCEFTSYVL